MYTVYKEIYLNVYEKIYKTILVIDGYPEILSKYIQKIKLPKLSNIHYNRPSVCVYCFHSQLNKYTPMELDELPYLIGLLEMNRCRIDYKMNKLLANHMKREFILSFTTEGF